MGTRPSFDSWQYVNPKMRIPVLLLTNNTDDRIFLCHLCQFSISIFLCRVWLDQNMTHGLTFKQWKYIFSLYGDMFLGDSAVFSYAIVREWIISHFRLHIMFIYCNNCNSFHYFLFIKLTPCWRLCSYKHWETEFQIKKNGIYVVVNIIFLK